MRRAKTSKAKRRPARGREDFFCGLSGSDWCFHAARRICELASKRIPLDEGPGSAEAAVTCLRIMAGIARSRGQLLQPEKIAAATREHRRLALEDAADVYRTALRRDNLVLAGAALEAIWELHRCGELVENGGSGDRARRQKAGPSR